MELLGLLQVLPADARDCVADCLGYGTVRTMLNRVFALQRDSDEEADDTALRWQNGFSPSNSNDDELEPSDFVPAADVAQPETETDVELRQRRQTNSIDDNAEGSAQVSELDVGTATATPEPDSSSSFSVSSDHSLRSALDDELTQQQQVNDDLSEGAGQFQRDDDDVEVEMDSADEPLVATGAPLVEVVIDDGMPTLLRRADGTEQALPLRVHTADVLRSLRALAALDAADPAAAAAPLPLLRNTAAGCSTAAEGSSATWLDSPDDEQDFLSASLGATRSNEQQYRGGSAAVDASGAVVFSRDGRAGISGTLHRVAAIQDASGQVIGLTLRVGRHKRGASLPLIDVIDSVAARAAPGGGMTAGGAGGSELSPSILIIRWARQRQDDDVKRHGAAAERRTCAGPEGRHCRRDERDRWLWAGAHCTSHAWCMLLYFVHDSTLCFCRTSSVPMIKPRCHIHDKRKRSGDRFCGASETSSLFIVH